MLEGLKPTKSKVHVCKVATNLQELDAADSQILAEAISDTKTWPAQTLATELRKRGLVISDGTITRHRKKTCACYREIG
tara:strand:+ start:274 stop:510 length:237 start_codon:yes stop_codon:yes gene_type:complete